MNVALDEHGLSRCYNVLFGEVLRFPFLMMGDEQGVIVLQCRFESLTYP